MLAVLSPGSDFKRYYRGRMPRLTLLVIILMPLLYSALYLWAFWNPFNEVDKMPVAVVNEDVGATAGGQKVDAGQQVVDGLVASKQLDLHMVSATEAADGVAHGKYYFSITLPKDFSASIVSPTTGDAKSADLIFTYNDTNNYLSTVMGQDAALQIIQQVGAQVGTNLFNVVFQNVDPMIGKITEAADGANELAAGLKTAKSGADQLNDGTRQLNDGVQQLSGAVTTATDPLVQALQQQQNSGGLTPPQLAALAQRLGTNAVTLNKVLGDAAGAQSQAYNLLDGVMKQLRANADPNVRALAGALEPVKQSLATRGLGPSANNQLTAVHDDTQLLAAQMSDPNSPLRLGLALLQKGDLLGDVQAARGAVDQLSSGTQQLSDGTQQLASGLGELSSGADQLASGLDAGAKAIPNWSKKQQEQLAAMLAQPVALKQHTENEAKTFGDGFAPFFFGLALFVGGIIAWMVFTPIQSRPLAQGLNSLRVVLASYMPTLGIGFLQAALMYLVVRFALGLDAVYPLATFAFMVLIIAMFLAMIQMFNAVFGPAVGRVVTLAFLMIQLTSAGGIYPVQTTALPFQYIHWVDPMTYTVNGLRQLTLGGVDYRLWVAIAVTGGLTLAFLLFSTLAARRNRQYNMDRLYPQVEV